MILCDLVLLPGGTLVTCMMLDAFPGVRYGNALLYAGPVRPLTTSGEELDHLEQIDQSDTSDRS